MAAIQSIHVTIITASIPNAGTEGGCVYLGICGREFRVDAADHGFKTGSGKKYIFGQGANVSCPDLNDPRAPYPLWTEHLLCVSLTGRGKLIYFLANPVE